MTLALIGILPQLLAAGIATETSEPLPASKAALLVLAEEARWASVGEPPTTYAAPIAAATATRAMAPAIRLWARSQDRAA